MPKRDPQPSTTNGLLRVPVDLDGIAISSDGQAMVAISDAAFYETKIATGRYYMARRLPATGMHLARIQSGAETVMSLEAANF